MFVPKLLVSLKSYSWGLFTKDLIAGMVVGVVALPLAMAFAIGSGVRPEKGIFTAIVAGFLISALGGSRVQIGGPTGAFVVIVAGIVGKFGYDGLVLATIMAGVLLVIMGFSRLGAAVKFIPYPVTTGFTSGIAVVIFSGQVNDLLGLGPGKIPAEFHLKWVTYFDKLQAIFADGAFPWPTVILSVFCLAVLIFWPRVTRRVPAPVVALIAGTLLACLFNYVLGWHVETIGTRYYAQPDGTIAIPNMVPTFVPPKLSELSLSRIEELAPSAMVIAVLAAIESLLSAVVADGMIGGRHKPNIELVAQGVANIASPLFGGIPATGAIARTATNVKTGGRTPVAGMIHALTLLIIMLAFAPLTYYIPLCSLAAILVIVSYGMAEIHKFKSLLRGPRADAVVLVVTFLLTVIFDLTVAVEVGLVLAFFLFIKRMADVTNVQVMTREMTDNGEPKDDNAISIRKVPHGVEVYEVNGPFFFGVVDKVKDLFGMVSGKPKVFILRMRNVPMMDATGLHALLELQKSCAHQGITLIVAEIHTQPFITLDRSGHREDFGADNVTAHIDDALNRAHKILGLPEVYERKERVPEVARDRPPPSTIFVREPAPPAGKT